MDFMALLAVANKNNQMNEKMAEKKSGFVTNLAPVKRVLTVKPKGVLSESVKAFLQKKEDEEKAKELEAKKKKEGLLQIRKDVKHTRKANAMAKRTKDNIHRMDEVLDEEAIREKERQERLKLEEKRLAMIEKLKESETSGGRKSRTATSVVTSSAEPVSDKQRRADKKLMAKYDDDLADEDDIDVKLEVITSDKQILDRDGYRAREEQRRKELQKEYKGRGTPADLKAEKRGLVKPKPMRDRREEKQKDKHKDKHKDKLKEGKDKHKEHKSKHKHKHKDKHKDKDKSKNKEPEPVAHKPRMLPKPKFIRPNNSKHVLNFQDLLKLANQKHESVLKPNAPAKKEEPVEKKKVKEGRLMTQEEKDRRARKKTKEYKEWYQKGGELKIDKSVHAVSSSSDDSSDDEPEESKPSSDQKLKNGYSQEAPTSKVPPSRDSSRSEEGAHQRDRPRPETKRPGLSSLPSRPQKSIRPAPAPAQAKPSVGSTNSKPQSSVKSASMAGVKRDSGGASKRPADAKPADAKPAHTNPFDRIMGQIKKNNPKPEKKPRRIESDEDSEYDEELDDFIASDEEDLDGFIDDTEAVDYSSAIKDIFGYDRRKYKDEDEADLRSMDVGFAVTMQEEARSAKIGRMEDLADMKMEEEENKRKMLHKKKMKMKMKGR